MRKCYIVLKFDSTDGDLTGFFGPGYRIYFVEQDDTIIILLCAGDKKSQKKDIKTAKMYWHEVLKGLGYRLAIQPDVIRKAG